MTSKIYTYLWITAVFFCFGMSNAEPLQASTVPEVTGFYDIVDATNLDTGQVQATLRIRLTNPNEESLTIEQLELQSLLSPKTAGESSPTAPATPLVLAVHDSRTIERRVTVLRAEYEHWRHGGRPRFLLQIETSGSERTSRILHLFPMKGIGE